MTRKISRTLVATVAACLLAFSSLGHAQAVDETPSALAMTGDAILFARHCWQPLLWAARSTWYPCPFHCWAATPMRLVKYW